MKEILSCFIALALALSFVFAAPYVCEKPADISLVVDTSNSMLSGSSPLMTELNSFPNSLNSSVDYLGLVTFADDAILQAPLSNNYNNYLNSLQGVTFIGNTFLGDGILKSNEDFSNLANTNPSRDSVGDYMIILSDGGPTVFLTNSGNKGYCDPQDNLPNFCSMYALEMATNAKNDGIEIYVISVGVTNSAKIQFLQGLSSGNGYYWPTNSYSGLDDMYDKIVEDICDDPVLADSDLVVSDDSDTQTIYVTQQDKFYAEYTDAQTGNPISTGACSISFDLGSGYSASSLMTYNSVTEKFEYSRSFSNAGTFSFLISCVDSSYDAKSASDTFVISEITGKLNADLFVSDDSDTQTVYINQQNGFYASYADDTFGNPISTGACQIAFDMTGSGVWGTPSNMVYNSVTEDFEYFASFPNAGTFDFLVECTDATYETLDVADTFVISESADPFANLHTWDDSDIEDVYMDEDINFYANYTDENGDLISTATCEIAFDLGNGYGNSFVMTYDSTLDLFVYETSFSQDGTFDYIIRCTDSTYPTLKESGEFKILKEKDDDDDCNDGDNDLVGYCEPNWQCGDWTGCHNGIKTRECVDLNDCEEFYVYGKPAESVACHVLVQEKNLEENNFNWLFWLLVGLAVLLVLLLVILSLRGGN